MKKKIIFKSPDRVDITKQMLSFDADIRKTKKNS